MQRETPIRLTKARKLTIPASVISKGQLTPYYNNDDDIFDLSNPILHGMVISYLLSLRPIIRGDWVYFECIPNYRNEGCGMYDGEKIVDIYRGYWDRGICNPNFEVINEFPLGFWEEVSGRYPLVWFTAAKYIDQIEMNKKTVTINLREWYLCLAEFYTYFRSYFTANDGQTYYIYYKNENNLQGKQIWSLNGDDYEDCGDEENSLFWNNGYQ